MSQDQAQKVLETAVEKLPKKHGCRRGCLACLGIFIILAIPVWYFCFHTTPLRVSKETTYVLGPMTSDGKRIDYFLAMEERYYPPEMKTDDNGYRLLVRACGVHTESSDPESYRQQVYEKLGLNPNIEPTLKLEDPFMVLEKYDKDHPVETKEDRLLIQFDESAMWTFDDYPMLKDWLEENNAGLDLLGEAVRKPVFHIPFIRKDENMPVAESLLFLRKLLPCRIGTRAALARAKYRLGTGNIDGAIDDIVTIFHLARHAGKQGTLGAWLVGHTFEGVARSIGIASNPDVQPTKAQIERLMTEINVLPPRWTWLDMVESERLYSLASIQDIHGANIMSSDDEPFPFYRNLLPNMTWTLDINIAMQRLNQRYDKALTLPGTFPDAITLADEGQQESNPINPLSLLFVRSRTNRIIDRLLSFFEIEMMYHVEPRLQCSDNIQRLTLALLLYEKEYNKLPEGDWREAVKPYLGENSEQYFRCPALDLAEGETTYAMIEGVTSSVSPNQILIVETVLPQRLGEGNGRIPLDKAVFVNQDKKTAQGLGSNHAGGIMAGYRSGSARFLSEVTKPEELRKLLE